jgi:aminoglycoside phosphotransferase (APT) family kinase protein
MLDPEVMPKRLAHFLAKQDPPIDGARVLDYQPLAGGYSRLMANFTLDHNGCSTRYVLRGDPPPGSSMMLSDRREEWDLLRALNTASKAPAPRACWFDPDGSELGTPALVMEWLEGRSLLAALHGVDDEPTLRTAADSLAELAAAVHATKLDGLPLHLRTSTTWDDYVDGRLSILERTDDELGGTDPLLRYLRVQLARHRPPPVALTLIHGDFQIPNVIVGADGRWSLIDWERARVGDPREDIGSWRVAAAATPPDLVGRDGPRFCAKYREITGLSEAEFNPATISYFTIAGSIDVYRDILAKVEAYKRGEIDGMMSAYLPTILALLRTTYLAAARELAADGIGAARC